ncbi:MAG: DMT family transporter [Arenicella sp.]
MSATIYYAVLALVAGIGIPVMASISSALGLRLASTSAAAMVLFSGAFIIALFATLLTGIPSIKSFQSAPPQLYIGGMFVAFYVLSITWLVPRFGVGNSIFLVLLGQILSASLIDHFGLFNTQATPLSAARLLGIVLMIIGLFLSRRVS